MTLRIEMCPVCGRQVGIHEEKYMNMALKIRCRLCKETWWVEIREKETTPNGVAVEDLKEAKRLAVFILKEVKLYHEKEIENAQTQKEVLQAVQKDLNLARKHYLSRVPQTIPDPEKIFDEAIHEVLLVGKK